MRLFYFNITFGCNNRCRFCCSHSTRSGVGCTITAADIKSLNERIGITSDDCIIVSGGEPTILDEFPKIISYFGKHTPHIIVYTNGRTLAEEDIRSVIPFVERIIVPVYGGRECHNTLAGREKAYDETISSLRATVPLFPEKFNLKFILQEDSSISDISDLIAAFPLLQYISFAGMVYDDRSHISDKRLYAELERLIEMQLSSGRQVNIYDLPLCLFSGVFLDKIHNQYDRSLNRKYDIYYCEAAQPPRTVKYDLPTTHFGKCTDCDLNGLCSMIMKNYYCLTMRNGICWKGTE